MLEANKPVPLPPAPMPVVVQAPPQASGIKLPKINISTCDGNMLHWTLKLDQNMRFKWQRYTQKAKRVPQYDETLAFLDLRAKKKDKEDYTTSVARFCN